MMAWSWVHLLFVAYGVMLLSLAPFVTAEGIEAATGEWSRVSSQLRLNCSLSPSNPAAGCLFVMLSYGSDKPLESILVHPEVSGCEIISTYEILCCDIECTVTSQANYRVYAVYDGGIVDSSISFEGNITENDSNNLCDFIPSVPIEESTYYKLSRGGVVGTGVAGFLHLVLTIILSGCTITLGIKFKNNEKQLKDIEKQKQLKDIEKQRRNEQQDIEMQTQ